MSIVVCAPSSHPGCINGSGGANRGGMFTHTTDCVRFAILNALALGG